MGKPIIMGRLTHLSLGRVLEGRHNIVLSRRRGFQTPDFQMPQISVAHSLEEAFKKACDVAPQTVKEIAIIGGASVYEQALPVANRIHLTVVHASIDGDVRFPHIDLGAWREVSRTEQPADARNRYDLSFIELVTNRGGNAKPRTRGE